MKKALAILMVLALVASAATAEITFGAWGRGLFVPLQNTGADDEDNSATTAVSWGTPNPRIGMTIKGVSENAGFQIDWNSDGAAFGISDQNKIWIKPVSMVTVSIGRVFDDTLRGNACFGAWDWYRAYSVVAAIGSEDFVFGRIDTLNQGFVVSVAPMDALYIVASFNDLGKYQKTEYLFGDFQIQAGYTIANIGQIRAGYKSVQTNEVEAFAGSGDVTGTKWVDANDDGIVDVGEVTNTYEVPATTASDADTAGTIEVAFKLTAIENLYVDIGVRMVTNTDIQADTKDINLYGSYKMDALKLHLITQFQLCNDIVNADGDDINSTFMVGAGVEYALANGIGLAGDVRYLSENSAIVHGYGVDATTSFFAGITKGFSNGNIGAGVEVISAENTGYAVPIRMEYSF